MLNFAAMLIQLIRFYEILIVIWCILSWLPLREGGIVYDIACAIERLVLPYLNLFRRFIPPMGGIDFSPIIAMMALELIMRLVLRILLG